MRKGARRRTLWLTLGLAGVAGVATVVAVVTGPGSTVEAAPAQVDAEHDHSEHDHASTLTADGRFTGPGEVWPPQVRGATDVVAVDLSEAEAPTEARSLPTEAAARLQRAEAGDELDLAMADAGVQAAIGDRYTVIGVTDDEIVPGSDKGDADARATLALFYSHDLSATVEVYLAGGRVLQVDSSPAGEHQPPLAVDEKYRATEVARAHWESAGDDRIDLLEGFVILAVEADGTYHDSRVVYVSFHLDNVARPELLTWVDLTSETVLNAEVDR